MANSALFRSIISNPTKITPKFLLNPSQILISRPFTSLESNSSDPVTELKPRSDPTRFTTLDPINNKPITVNPKKMVEELFKARTEGLFVSARKVFDRMSKRLRPFNNNRKFTHEAMELSKGSNARIPDVIAHIAVLEAYANAGLTNHNDQMIYLKMLGPGYIPNEHTYNMLIKLLATTSDGDSMKFRQAEKYIVEMLDKGMKPDAETTVSIFKALAKEGRVREGKEILEHMKAKGFVIDDKVFKEIVKGNGGGVIRVLKGKQGNVVKTMLEIFFDKKI